MGMYSQGNREAYYREAMAQNVMNRILEARFRVLASPLTQEEMRSVAEQAFVMADEMIAARDRTRCCKECGKERY